MSSNNGKDPHTGMHLTSVLNKEIMSQIRKGDYQHAGEEEAIELLFQDIPKKENQWLLDVGCGRGGTANYLQKNDWGNVVGIDINPDIIEVANKKYGNQKNEKSSPLFFHSDILNAERTLNQGLQKSMTFDVIYLMHVFFLFPDQSTALQALTKLAHDKTCLAIFAYTDYGHYMENPYKENNKLLMPNMIQFDKIENLFSISGWKVTAIESTDEECIRWYTELMDKIENLREKYTEKFGSEIFNCFVQRYQHLFDVFCEKIIGNVIITAKPK